MQRLVALLTDVGPSLVAGLATMKTMRMTTQKTMRTVRDNVNLGVIHQHHWMVNRAGCWSLCGRHQSGPHHGDVQW